MELVLNNVSVTFRSGHSVQAVKNVEFEIKEKEKIAIVGETGSGKSILLLSILRLLPQNAEISGEILFQGRDLLKVRKKEMTHIRGRKIAYIPQGSGNSLNPLYNVGTQISEPMVEHLGMNKKEGFQKAVELLKRFKIGNEDVMAKKYPHTYSGGMRQRALIAMGIGAGASMLLADEPTKGLDGRRISLVVESFRMLMDKTILCVTHDLNFAEKISERICVMYAASQVELGVTEDILHDPLHPYTKDLLASMPENGLKYFPGFAIPHDDYDSMGCKYAFRCRYRHERCAKMPPFFHVGNRRVRCWKYEKSDGSQMLQ